jgi:hypothetical protein
MATILVGAAGVSKSTSANGKRSQRQADFLHVFLLTQSGPSKCAACNQTCLRDLHAHLPIFSASSTIFESQPRCRRTAPKEIQLRRIGCEYLHGPGQGYLGFDSTACSARNELPPRTMKMPKKAKFDLAHNEAFKHYKVQEVGTHWSAFDVPKDAAPTRAKRFAMAIWHERDPEDMRLGAPCSILHDGLTDSYWYEFPWEGSVPQFRKNVWTSLKIASERRLEMIGFLKKANSHPSPCSVEFEIRIEEVVFSEAESTAWLRLTCASTGEFGCEVGEVDLTHVTSRSSLADPLLLQRARRPIPDAPPTLAIGGPVLPWQAKAACRIAEQVFLKIKPRAEAIALLTSAFYFDTKTAGHLIRIYAFLVDGQPFTTNPAAATVALFSEEILTTFGEGTRPNLIRSLTGYVDHIGPGANGEREMESVPRRLREGKISSSVVGARLASSTLHSIQTLPAHTASEILKEIWVRGPAHARFRTALRNRWNENCSVHGVSCNGRLRASHIVAWRLDESLREDVNNGLLLSAPLDDLFDKGLIAFGANGKVMFSTKLAPDTQKHFAIHPDLQIDWSHVDEYGRTQMRKNLARHREFHAFEHGYPS